MDKRPIGYVAGKASVLDKKIPKTHKYDHVESKLAGKTGTTVKDVEFISSKQAAKRKGEHFKRIKPSTVWKMLNQEIKTQSIYNWQKQSQDDAKSQTSNLTSVTIKTEQLPVGVQTDFVLIDLRDAQEYSQYHIKQALSYPGTHIKQEKTIPQLYHYKNKDNKIIIVYHFDEKLGINYAAQMFEKGYDNIYLISGGIQALGQEIPEALQGKEIPQFTKKEEIRKFKKTRNN